MADANDCVLGIDLGTSGPKVAVATVTGNILDSDFAPTPVNLLPGGGAEQSPAQWWEAITTACRRLLSRIDLKAHPIRGLCCTAQWSGTVAVDATGEPLMDAVIWMDARGGPHVRDILGGPITIEGYGPFKIHHWLRLAGGAPAHSGKDPVGHILFLKNEHPDIYARTHVFLEPKDYINLKLTGRIAASFDSITLHWLTDNRRLDRIAYHPKLLALTGIDPTKVPPLKSAVDTLGPLTPEAAADLGLPAGVPVVMGTPDVYSAAIGAGAVLDYETHLYFGSSSWVGCHVPFKRVDVSRHVASVPSANPARYFVANSQDIAGRCLDFVLNNLLFHDDPLHVGPKPDNAFARLDQTASLAPPGSDGLLFTPWLYGERSPVDEPTLRGGWFNLSLQHTRAHWVRAVLEGVAFNTKWLFQAVEHFIRRPITELAFIGGGARSTLWCQILADVLGCDILRRAQPLLANARGAAFIAAVGLGHLRFEDIPQYVVTEHRYRPNPENRDLYERLFTAYLKIYKNNRKLYRDLNQTAGPPTAPMPSEETP